MSHVTPLSFSKDCIVHCCIVCLSGLVMLPSLLSCYPMFKGRKRFTSTVKTTFVSVILNHFYGYIIYNIPEHFSEFHVVDVGFIMALLRRDYSCRHQLIIQEIVLETNLVPWDLYASMIDFSLSTKVHIIILWSKDFAGCSTPRHLFTFSKLY